MENAECCNLPAEYVCKCKPGFEGDGQVECRGEWMKISDLRNNIGVASPIAVTTAINMNKCARKAQGMLSS